VFLPWVLVIAGFGCWVSQVIFLSFLAGMSCPIRTYFGGY
jgi:hypothetical protein